MEEEAVGRIVLPANMTKSRLERSVVLAVGSEVTDLHPGDVVLVVSDKTVELRETARSSCDGSMPSPACATPDPHAVN